MQNLRILAIILAVFSFTSAAGATMYDFNTPVPGGADFINNVSPNYMGLTFGDHVGIISQSLATSSGWEGIRDSAGLFLPAGFTDFSIIFPATVSEVSFLIASPIGNQLITVNGAFISVDASPFIKTLVLNSQTLQITAQSIFTLDNLATAPSAVPVPPAIWLLGSSLIGLIGLRRLHG